MVKSTPEDEFAHESSEECEEEVDIYTHLGIVREIEQKDIKKKYHIACLKY